MEDMFTRTNGYFLSHAKLIQANWTYLEVKLWQRLISFHFYEQYDFLFHVTLPCNEGFGKQPGQNMTHPFLPNAEDAETILNNMGFFG